MEFTVKINCKTIQELEDALDGLVKQVKVSAKKQKYNPQTQGFIAEDADTLCDDYCNVTIKK